MSKNKLGAYIQKLMTVIVDKEEGQFNKDLAYSELKRLNSDEFDFIYRFLDTINNDWQKVNENTLANPTPTVTVDGKEYRPIRG